MKLMHDFWCPLALMIHTGGVQGRLKRGSLAGRSDNYANIDSYIEYRRWTRHARARVPVVDARRVGREDGSPGASSAGGVAWPVSIRRRTVQLDSADGAVPSSHLL